MTTKVHTKLKRKLSLSSHFKHKFFLKGVNKTNRPKTFKTEEAANAYAKENGIKSYSLKKVKKDLKFQIVQKEAPKAAAKKSTKAQKE